MVNIPVGATAIVTVYFCVAPALFVSVRVYVVVAVTVSAFEPFTATVPTP
jgi:hypothetical protein